MKRITLETKIPIFKSEVLHHAKNKNIILKAIESLGVHGLVEKDQQIYNTDWYLSGEIYRPYYELMRPIMESVCREIYDVIQATGTQQYGIRNYWFQQYKSGDYHKLHTHVGTSFSCVYYLDLPEKASPITFKLYGKEFVVPVKEGEILAFPGFIPHLSEPTKANKTVIVFNI
jgi:hypothetical protein